MAAARDFGEIKNKNTGEQSYDQPVLEPLSFPDHNSKPNFSIPLFCLLCDKMFKDVGMEKSDALLHHLLVEHQFVIADVELIADFKSYIHYWKRRFRELPITEFCSVININSRAEDIGPKLQYNLLCDGLPEDKQLREQLQMSKLQGILQLQQQERTESHFSRNCLFCSTHFDGNRSVLFQHMVDQHSFNVGLPDNLVYVNELLDKLEEKLNNLQCVFCDKTYKDKQTLKDHMRKKQHKKINPKNKEFDKYYLINYLEVGKNWHDILDEDDSEIHKKSKDESWEDWQEESIPIHCLFCEVTSPVSQNILNHMKECHNFDLLKIKKNQGLNFYEEVKIVNYIRRQVYNLRCIFCKEKLSAKEALLHHLQEMSHFQLPDKNSSWDQPQYFFPTFENDGLLCGLPDDDDDDDDDDDNESDDDCESTVCGNDDVNCAIPTGQLHLTRGNVKTDSEMSCNIIKNENSGINICQKDDNSNPDAMVGIDEESPDEKCGSSKSDDDDCEHDTEVRSDLNDENDLAASLLLDNNDGAKDYDHVGNGNDELPDKCTSNDGDDQNVDQTKNEINNEDESSAVFVNNDDGDEVSDHTGIGNEKQQDNKCGSNNGDDVEHIKDELNDKSESFAVSVSNDDSGMHVVTGSNGSKQSDNKCGSDGGDDDGENERCDTENEINNDN